MVKRARELYLVRRNHTWAICFKATGRLGNSRIAAWLRDVDEAYFCEVGTEAQIEMLPNSENRNFFGDVFTFAIDETDEKFNRITRLGGCISAGAAGAAFDKLRTELPAGRHVILRQGARIMRKSDVD